MTHEEFMELMVGDLMLGTYDDGESEYDVVVEIDGIDDNSTLVDGDCDISWNPVNIEHAEVEYLDDIRPIPITEDFLLNNGFKKDMSYGFSSKDYGVYHNYDGEEGFSIFRYCTKEDVKRIELPKPMIYVHELQHVLRLCGFKQEAENLKAN